ncbi:PqqD family protein [Rothia mucilaginosa]|uniref:PqqD family protein n=1 Tax=Rothia mucilaginosa TaxID=43675 RepID=UPI0025E6C616|nr:PqqD family protein [Rothia mucilaginosa]
MTVPADSPQTAPVYGIPKNIAYVHSEEFAKYSPTATYIANLDTGEHSILQDSASIIWDIFEEPTSEEEAIETICELYEQPVEVIAPQIRAFIPDLLSKNLLEII